MGRYDVILYLASARKELVLITDTTTSRLVRQDDGLGVSNAISHTDS